VPIAKNSESLAKNSGPPPPDTASPDYSAGQTDSPAGMHGGLDTGGMLLTLVRTARQMDRMRKKIIGMGFTWAIRNLAEEELYRQGFDETFVYLATTEELKRHVSDHYPER